MVVPPRCSPTHNPCTGHTIQKVRFIPFHARIAAAWRKGQKRHVVGNPLGSGACFAAGGVKGRKSVTEPLEKTSVAHPRVFTE